MARTDPAPVTLAGNKTSVRVHPGEGMRIVWIRKEKSDLIHPGDSQLTVFGAGDGQGHDLASTAWRVYESPAGDASWVTGQLDPRRDRRLAAALPDIRYVRVTVSLTRWSVLVYTTVAVPPRSEPRGVGFTWQAQLIVNDPWATIDVGRSKLLCRNLLDTSMTIRAGDPHRFRLAQQDRRVFVSLTCDRGLGRIHLSRNRSALRAAISKDDGGGVERHSGLDVAWLAAHVSMTADMLGVADGDGGRKR
jgi:hypothetical protein